MNEIESKVKWAIIATLLVITLFFAYLMNVF